MLTPQEWLDIFIDRVNELRIKNEYPANVDIEDVNTPKCYFAFLVENISEDKIELSNDVTIQRKGMAGYQASNKA